MKKYIVEVNNVGDVFWKNQFGELHREEGPAVEYVDGYRAWYRKGKRHREDGPAVEGLNNVCEWWINGERHREDGPAIDRPDGDRRWFKHGELHREEGPAIEFADGANGYYINGVPYTKKEFLARARITKKELTVTQIESLLGYSIKIIKD